MNIIKKRRIKLNITQRHLAIFCNVQQSYISQLEKFKKAPSVGFTLLLGKKLHICPLLILENYVCRKCSFKKSCKCKF